MGEGSVGRKEVGDVGDWRWVTLAIGGGWCWRNGCGWRWWMGEGSNRENIVGRHFVRF